MTATNHEAEAARAMRLADSAFEIAQLCEIDSPDMLEIAGGELVAVVTRRKEFEEQRRSFTKPLDDLKTRITELFRRPIERLAAAEGLLRGAVGKYQQLEREKAQAAQRQAAAEAQAERERSERAARDAAVEAERAATEAAEAIESGADDAEEALENAQRLEAAAQDKAFAAETAAVAPANLPAIIPTKVKGVGLRQNWKAEVIDFRALVKAAAAADDDFLLGFLAPDATAIGKAARALQARLVVPGVRVYAEDSLSVRKASAVVA